MNPKKLILLPKSKVKIVYDNRTEEVKKAGPIMMKPWGIEATLEERKTVTRGIVIPQPKNINTPYEVYIQWKNCFVDKSTIIKNCRQGKPGDLLYIRKNYYVRREDVEVWLLINDVRCERLQDITEKDCLKEGIINAYCKLECPSFLHGCRCDATCNQVGNCDKTQELKRQFAKEWNKINANQKGKNGNILPYAWKDNPWVFPIGYSLFFVGRGVYEM